MTKISARLIALFVILVFISPLGGQSTSALPRIEGENLAGKDVVLPDASAGEVAVLIFGFSKASKNPTNAWATKLYDDLGNRSGFEIYQLPVLEDVPRFIRGMVISSMKKGVAQNRRDHFIPIVRGGDELKKLVNYREPDDAYLVLIDRSGMIVQQEHGQYDSASYSRFRGEIEASLGNQK